MCPAQDTSPDFGLIHQPFPPPADNPCEGVLAMIELTRLNGRPIVLNSDLIKTAEASPDTMLTLINGEKLIVREETAEVVERVLAYRARLLAAVAKRLPSYGELQKAVALTSLDVSGQPKPASTPNGNHSDDDNR
jgi:flagellar protein FlbD